MSLNDNPRALEKKKNTNKQLNSEAVEILGEDLVEILRFANPPVPEREIPESVEKNIMDSYRKAYRYKIRWRKVKINIRDFISFLSSNARTNAVVLASVVMVFIIIAAVYYQYQSNHIKPDLTSNKQPPVIKITPTPTPEVTPIATPNIAENNKSDNKELLRNDTNNHEKPKLANDKQKDKINKSKNESLNKNDGLKNEIANNHMTNKNGIGIKEASSATRGNSAIRTISISNLIEASLIEELKTLIIASGKIELVKDDEDKTKADAILQWAFSEQNLMILSTNTNPIIWEKKVKPGTAKEQAESIVLPLLESIEKFNKEIEEKK